MICYTSIFTFTYGLIIQETAKPNVVVATYKDPDSHRRFVIVVKILYSGAESYLCLFPARAKRSDRLFLQARHHP